MLQDAINPSGEGTSCDSKKQQKRASKSNKENKSKSCTFRKDMVSSFDGEGLCMGSGCTHKSTTCTVTRKPVATLLYLWLYQTVLSIRKAHLRESPRERWYLVPILSSHQHRRMPLQFEHHNLYNRQPNKLGLTLTPEKL